MSTAPTLTRDDEALEAFGDALSDFLRAVHHVRGRFAASQPPGELSISQYKLVERLASAAEPLPVSELALAAGVSAPTATRMLTGLERDGLVARERSVAGDRRQVFISLTAEGRDRVERKRGQIAEVRRAMFASFSDDERRQAAQILTRLAAAMEDYR